METVTGYTLIRSKRKTMALCIRNGGAEVRAPLNARKSDIEKFIASHQKWITDKLAAAQSRQRRRESLCLTYGSETLYRGRLYPIAENEGDRAGFDGARFYMPPGLTPEQIKSACIQIYRMLAKRYLTERVTELAKKMSVTPSNLKVNGAKTRWGSCSAKKSLNFSWRLVRADDDVIDYVAVHELAHILEMNHSPRFWAVVESVLPDYRERRKRLRGLRDKFTD